MEPPETAAQSARSWWRWVPFLLVLALVVGAICAATFRVPNAIFGWIHRHPGLDKALHFFMIGLLALALNWGLRGRRFQLGRASFLLGGVIVAVVITLEECSQLWISTRSFDWGDLVANYAGIACADWLARRPWRRLRG